jgi:hypothetical protein
VEFLLVIIGVSITKIKYNTQALYSKIVKSHSQSYLCHQCDEKGTSGWCYLLVYDEPEDESVGNGWSRFWLWWLGFLTTICSCVAFAWVNFPENIAVQLSQEYAMKGLLVLIAVMVRTILVRVLWKSCRNGGTVSPPGRWSWMAPVIRA